MYAKANMANIFNIIPINVSKNNGVIENTIIKLDYYPKEYQVYTTLFKEYHDTFSWSYEEMLGVDPWIFEHKIKTYENLKLVQQNSDQLILGRHPPLRKR